MELSDWRLIISHPATGAWNMALDEAILEAVGQKSSPPTLRLYRWSPPCLSLGYAQPIADVNPPTIKKNNWDVVRRPTGGRAILHTDELTYSVMAHQDEPHVTGGVIESYRHLSKALLRGLQLLGLGARADKEYSSLPVEQTHKAVCFEVPSKYEITVNGKKLIGSAQARRHHGVLQHGSLPLFGDLSRITQVLSFQDSDARSLAATRLLERATTIESCLHRRPSWDEAAEAFIQAFKETLNLNFVLDEPEAREITRASELVKTKYAHKDWIERH
jgi:lipoyl(octanoyl) transferase